MAGPALGGVLVGTLGASAVFALDAVSFGASAIALMLMRPAATRAPEKAGGSVLADLRDGWRFVRERRWLWVTFASAAVAYLLFMGPVEVLVPYIVKHDLHASASDLGLIFGAGGLASILMAAIVGRHRLAGRNLTFMYVAWTAATIAVAGYGIGTATWHLMLASAAFNSLETAGTIVWATAKQAHVPSRHARPRVESGLADLDRAPAALLRAHWTGQRTDRRPKHTRHRRNDRSGCDARGNVRSRRPPAARRTLARRDHGRQRGARLTASAQATGGLHNSNLAKAERRLGYRHDVHGHSRDGGGGRDVADA